MVVLSYKRFDGGLNQAEISHIRANQEANQYNELDQMETLELNIRRFYETLNADRLKQKSTELGVATAETPNATDPTRFPTTIHQDRSRGRQRPAPWHTSAHDR